MYSHLFKERKVHTTFANPTIQKHTAESPCKHLKTDAPYSLTVLFHFSITCKVTVVCLCNAKTLKNHTIKRLSTVGLQTECGLHTEEKEMAVQIKERTRSGSQATQQLLSKYFKKLRVSHSPILLIFLQIDKYKNQASRG